MYLLHFSLENDRKNTVEMGVQMYLLYYDLFFKEKKITIEIMIEKRWRNKWWSLPKIFWFHKHTYFWYNHFCYYYEERHTKNKQQQNTHSAFLIISKFILYISHFINRFYLLNSRILNESHLSIELEICNNKQIIRIIVRVFTFPLLTLKSVFLITINSSSGAATAAEQQQQ